MTRPQPGGASITTYNNFAAEPDLDVVVADGQQWLTFRGGKVGYNPSLQ